MATDADALVIGGGPAGASTAILLAKAGWRVILAEQQVYLAELRPREGSLEDFFLEVTGEEQPDD